MASKKKTRSYEWFKDHQSLSEIYQSIEMKFSLAGETEEKVVQQAHPWVKCRDFLHDAVRSQLTGIKSRIYGFCYYPKDDAYPAISTDKTLMFVSQQTIKNVKKYREHLSRALKFIHYYENLIGVPNSSLKKVPMKYCEDLKSYKHVWLFEGDVFWISAPYMVSMLTMLLRLGIKLPSTTVVDNPEKVYKTILDKYEKEMGELKKKGKNPKKDNDLEYMKTCYNKLSKLVTMVDALKPVHGDGVFSNMYNKDITISSFHDRTGILSACKGTTWNTEFNTIVKGAFE